MEIGLPAGVLNIVHGDGDSVGEAIAQHPGIDMVSFTGSVRAGRRVSALGGRDHQESDAGARRQVGLRRPRRCAAREGDSRGVNNAMLNSGQTCSAWTRMVVPRGRLEEVLEIATTALAALTVGDPMDPRAKLGPLISEAQRRRVEGYIAAGVSEGARLVAGGKRPAAFSRGHYLEPTIFSDVQSAMTIAREEIFGPVLAILPYDTEDEAIAIANDTIYGLAGGVWSGDKDRAMGVARRIRTGQVDVNGARFNPLAPFGGYRQSGIGREFGKYGLDEYLQTKAIQC